MFMDESLGFLHDRFTRIFELAFDKFYNCALVADPIEQLIKQIDGVPYGNIPTLRRTAAFVLEFCFFDFEDLPCY